MRSGELSAELLLHRKDCLDCREMLRAGDFLRRDSSLLQTQAELPPAMQIWEEAQRRQKLVVLERASRIFLGLKVAGVLYAIAFLCWSLYSLAGSADQELFSAFGGKALTATIAGVGLAVVFVGGGLWYALRGDERLTG